MVFSVVGGEILSYSQLEGRTDSNVL